MKQKSIFERFTLKQQISITKQAETMRTLNSELDKSREVADQLNEIAKQTEIKPGKTNAMSLRSSSWYGNKVQEQLETAENRNKFLQQEVEDTRKMLAKAMQRKNKSEESWQKNIAIQRAHKEEKLDQEISNRKRLSGKFGK